MTIIDSDIYPNEVRNLIFKLIHFFGSNNIEKCLRRYEISLSSSGTIYREYLKTRHPWWNALKCFTEMEKSGKSMRKHLSADIKKLAVDAKRITILQKSMPDKVKAKFKRDLTDDKRAYDYLFELNIAWHYFIKGHSISWYEEDGCPEFFVETPDFDFNVECKRISLDASRKIRRRDFYRLVDKLEPQIRRLNCKGRIDVEITDRLHSNEQFIDCLSSQILRLVPNNGHFETSFGSLFLNLRNQNEEKVDLSKSYQVLCDRIPTEAHGVIIAPSNKQNNFPINPLEFTLNSRKAANVLEGITKKIEEASKQLDDSYPGLITCFLEGIIELSGLSNKGGLLQISSHLFAKERFSHIAAIGFCSEGRIVEHDNFENFNFQGLLFRNPNCVFRKAKNFHFLSEEIVNL